MTSRSLTDRLTALVVARLERHRGVIDQLTPAELRELNLRVQHARRGSPGTFDASLELRLTEPERP